MATIYLKSSDERTVVSLNNRRTEPKVPQFLIDRGYQKIDQNEFRKLKRRFISARTGRVTK